MKDAVLGASRAGDPAAGDRAASDSRGGDEAVDRAPVPDAVVLARNVLETCARQDLSLGVAESLTGGLLASTIVSVPGASAVFRGGLVAYATAVKADVLGVDAGLLADAGAVDPQVALAMADGVCRLLSAGLGLATTGVAGPTPQDGKGVGCAYIAARTPGGRQVRHLQLAGDRQEIREKCVYEVLLLALDTLTG